MKKRSWLILTGCLVIGLAIAATWWWMPRPRPLPPEVMTGLREVKSWTLISLEPYRANDSDNQNDGIKHLHGFPVLGRLPLSNSQPAIDAVEEIGKAARPDNTKCPFEPRHALTGQMADGRKLEILIDYENGVFLLYFNEIYEGDFYFSRPNPKPLNDLLRSNGFPLPKQP